MKISKEAKRSSRQLFRACMVDGVMDESRVRSVVEKVSVAKPRRYLSILDAFAGLVGAEMERQRAVVESATDLEESTRDELKSSLSRKYSRALEVEFRIEPQLLGGIRVRVGSDVWDGSVRARLESLKAQLS